MTIAEVDMQSLQLSNDIRKATKHKKSIENLRYLNRGILVINFVYGINVYIDLMVERSLTVQNLVWR